MRNVKDTHPAKLCESLILNFYNRINTFAWKSVSYRQDEFFVKII